MAEANAIVKFGNGHVDKAKQMQIDPANFINLDTTNTAIRYKRMAPIVIASRLKTMLADITNNDENKKLCGFIEELETAQKYGIDEGKCELIHWSALQSQNTIHASLGVYHLYSSNGKPVCDFVFISTTQRRTIDKTSVGLGWFAVAAALGAFIPVLGPVLAAGMALNAVAAARSNVKDMIANDQGDILLLKTLEHYGLVRLIGNDLIQLINE